MKAIVKEHLGQALFYMQNHQGARYKPLIRLARLAAEDEDNELGRVVTKMALEAINADHNIEMITNPFVPISLCKACADDIVSRFRSAFGAWMTPADQNRLSFIEHELYQAIDAAGGGERCPSHRIIGLSDTFELEFVDDDEDDED